ncbi:MAG: hypothetical protein KBB64_05725 [Bacteroidia bacterium]|jgi:hypothetical protein|nr:hypothetical protein [Bacteroidia bacterium]
MKKLFASGILIAAAFLFPACDKDNLTAFEFTNDYASFNITVTPTTTMGDLSLGTVEVETDIQELVSDNGVNVDNLKSIKITGIKLTILDNDPSPYTFDILSKVNSRVGSTTGGTMIEFAKKDPVPTGGLTTLDLDINNVELLDYLKKTKFKFDINGATTDSIDHSFDVKVELKVKFEGELIK